MHTAVNKAIRVGRATALAIGVGVVLALVLGLATVALAAVPGDPLKLGKVNVINNATTTLQSSGLSGPLSSSVLQVKRDGTTGGPALTVNNTSTSGAARGIDINVPTGEMPINVNSGAGKADLNVDQVDGRSANEFLGNTATAVNANRLDGQDSTFFAFGTNGKANDANNLDGKDSTAFFSGKTYEVTDEVQGEGDGDGIRVFAECDPEDRILSGGYEFKGNEDEVASNEPSIDGDVPQAWFVFYEDFGAPNAFEVKAICADFPPLR